MPVYRLTTEAIIPLPRTTYAAQGVRERSDLQRLLRANIAVVAPDVLVIAEEFGDWDESKRRIDLLGIDRDAALVVIELKRDDDGGHMELQAIRYAAMVSRMTLQRAIEVYQACLGPDAAAGAARTAILAWLRTSEPPRDEAVLDVRIVLVSADFKKELTTAVLWLREWELDIRCVRVKPYADTHGMILEVQEIVPLPEAAEYQVSIRDEAISRREVARQSGEATGYWFMNVGEDETGGRSWEDCRRYGFLSSGGTEQHQQHARALRVGDKVFAYLSSHGYVGVGEVTADAVPQKDFIPVGESSRLVELPVTAQLRPAYWESPVSDWCVAVRWAVALPREQAVLRARFRRPTFQAIRQPALVQELLSALQTAAVS